MVLIDAPVLNSVCACKLPICMLYSTRKPSLIIASLDVTSQADESSESSIIIVPKHFSFTYIYERNK